WHIPPARPGRGTARLCDQGSPQSCRRAALYRKSPTSTPLRTPHSTFATWHLCELRSCDWRSCQGRRRLARDRQGPRWSHSHLDWAHRRDRRVVLEAGTAGGLYVSVTGGFSDRRRRPSRRQLRQGLMLIAALAAVITATLSPVAHG